MSIEVQVAVEYRIGEIKNTMINLDKTYQLVLLRVLIVHWCIDMRENVDFSRLGLILL